MRFKVAFREGTVVVNVNSNSQSPANSSHLKEPSNLSERYGSPLVPSNGFQSPELKQRLTYTYMEQDSKLYRSILADDNLLSTSKQQSFLGNQSNYYASPVQDNFKKDYEKMLSKVEDQEKQLTKLNVERDRYLHELTSLTDNMYRNRNSAKTPEQELGGFQFWHLAIVALSSLIIGALLSA